MPTAYAPTPLHPIPAHSHGVAERVAATLRQIWQDYRAWRARRATILALQKLDDHTLHDLGLARSEVESVVYDEAGEHLRRYDSDWRSASRGSRRAARTPDLI